jgi:ribosomal protein L24
MLYEPLEHLSKRFKERQRVKVSAGADAGKTGIILKVEPKMVEVWTDNENSIRVNKKNLELHRGEAIC